MLSHHSKFVCRTFSQNSGKFADIVVVGGGLVGSALACKLAKSQWLTSRKICLLESSPKKPAISQDVSNTPFSNRLVLYGPYKIYNLAMKLLLHN
jgi:choline dehydrogenase-like flavoprotein